MKWIHKYIVAKAPKWNQMSVLALKLYSWYSAYTVNSHQLRNFVNGNVYHVLVIPWEIAHL